MENINVDTKKMHEYAKDLMLLTNDIHETLDSLFNRLSVINSKTNEWVGLSSENFIKKINVEKIDYFELTKILYQYGKQLDQAATLFENASDKGRYDK